MGKKNERFTRKQESSLSKMPLSCLSGLILHWLHFSLCWITPFWIRSGTSTASQGPSPSAMRWASPNLGTFLAHRGLKWSVRHILPPLYIFAVFPSSSGTAISGAVVGYVIGIWRNYKAFIKQRTEREMNLSNWTYIFLGWTACSVGPPSGMYMLGF